MKAKNVIIALFAGIIAMMFAAAHPVAGILVATFIILLLVPHDEL